MQISITFCLYTSCFIRSQFLTKKNVDSELFWFLRQFSVLYCYTTSSILQPFATDFIIQAIFVYQKNHFILRFIKWHSNNTGRPLKLNALNHLERMTLLFTYKLITSKMIQKKYDSPLLKSTNKVANKLCHKASKCETLSAIRQSILLYNIQLYMFLYVMFFVPHLIQMCTNLWQLHGITVNQKWFGKAGEITAEDE